MYSMTAHQRKAGLLVSLTLMLIRSLEQPRDFSPSLEISSRLLWRVLKCVGFLDAEYNDIMNMLAIVLHMGDIVSGCFCFLLTGGSGPRW